MGCYGIGITRLLAAIVEQHHDEHGLIWPKNVAPFQVHVIPVSSKDATQQACAEDLYQQLRAQGIDALLDDRKEKPGVKFKDADLIGIPLQIIVGRDAAEGLVELKQRGGDVSKLSVEQAVGAIRGLV
jgi:prolyl-tRNA synthetase